ncbi:MAG: hypothetical protein Kow0067_01330 [Coriobacteriia bacterium]
MARGTRAFALVLALLLSAQGGAAHAATLPCFAREAGQETVLSEMAIHPAAIRAGDVTYIAYQGVGFDPMLVTYAETTGVWRGPYRLGTNALRLDAHGAPALYRDPAGRLHAFYGCHATAMRHVRSAPDDPSRWQRLADLSSATYPQAVDHGGGRMSLFYRSGAQHWVLRSSEDGAETFGPELRVLQADANRAYWYADLRRAPDGQLDLAFTWHDRQLFMTGLWFVRRNAYYAYRDLAGAWRGADGVALSLPIDLAEADAHCKIFDSGAELVNEITVKRDDTGAPCVLFLTGAGAGPWTYDWRFMRKSGSSWSSRAIVTTDHFFDAAAFECLPGGAVEAFVVTGDSDARGSTDNDYRGRGGRIELWTSADRGLTWRKDRVVSPAEPGVLYSDPVFVRDGTRDARLVFTDWTNDESNFFHRLFLWGDSGIVTRETPPNVERLAGRNRGLTSVEISREAFPEGARWVVLATERDFPDALAGAPLAGALRAPVLLTNPGYLPDEIATEIRRLGARNAVVLGGTDVVSGRVQRELSSMAGCTYVERVAGANRFETGLAIARRMRDPSRSITTAVVVNGRNWPDAVAAGPLAVANDWPIVLTESYGLPSASKTILREYGISSTLIVGGADVVGTRVQSSCPRPVRVGGADRFETAALLAEHGLSHGLLSGRMVLATGRNFPDALAGSSLGGRSRSPILLVNGADVTVPTRAYLRRHADRMADVWLLGEPDVVGDAVEREVSTVLAAE